MVKTVSGRPGRLDSPAGPSSGASVGFRRRASIFIRRRRLAPYLLILPSAAVIAVLVLWPTIQIAEFSLSLRLSVLSAAAMVPLTLIVGTLVGLLLSRLGRKMAAFVSSVSILAWATPAVSASV